MSNRRRVGGWAAQPYLLQYRYPLCFPHDFQTVWISKTVRKNKSEPVRVVQQCRWVGSNVTLNPALLRGLKHFIRHSSSRGADRVGR